MPETRNWICPEMCGCELKIIGTWIFPIDYVSANPSRGSVRSVDIVNVCDTHLPLLSQPIDETVFFSGDDGNPILDENDQPIQVRGYLTYPITNPSDGEKLYSYLSRYGIFFNTLDTCGCKTSDSVNGYDGTRRPVCHPQMKKCKLHKADDDLLTQARDENVTKNYSIKAVIESDPSIREADVVWSFGKGRKLDLSIPKATLQQKTTLQNAIDSQLGTGKVNLV